MAEDTETVEYPTVPKEDLADIFSYRVDVNLESPALQEWHDSNRPQFIRNMFGKLFERDLAPDEDQQQELRQIAGELLGYEVPVSFSNSSLNILDDEELILGQTDGEEIRLSTSASVSVLFPEMASIFKPNIPSAFTPKLLYAMTLIHEAEHVTQFNSGKGYGGDEESVDLENDADNAIVKFLRDQPRGDKLAETWLNARAHRALFINVANEELSWGADVIEHDTSLGIRHYERTGEVLDFQELIDANQDLTKKIVEYINEKELGLDDDNEYPADIDEELIDRYVAVVSDAIMEADEDVRQEMVDAFKAEYGGSDLDEAVENMLEEVGTSDEIREYVAGSIYNPVVILTALEDIVAGEDLTEMESYMATNAIESLRDLGYSPLKGDDFQTHVADVLKVFETDMKRNTREQRSDLRESIREISETIRSQRAEEADIEAEEAVVPESAEPDGNPITRPNNLGSSPLRPR